MKLHSKFRLWNPVLGMYLWFACYTNKVWKFSSMMTTDTTLIYLIAQNKYKHIGIRIGYAFFVGIIYA